MSKKKLSFFVQDLNVPNKLSKGNLTSMEMPLIDNSSLVSFLVCEYNLSLLSRSML